MKRIILLGVVLMSSACAQLLGVKSYKSGPSGTEIAFTTGVDFGVGLNGIDRVNNQRGISPSEYSTAKAVEAKY